MKTPNIVTAFGAVFIASALTLGSVLANALEDKAKVVVIQKIELNGATPEVALRTISNLSNVKILYTPSHADQGNVTLSLNDVPTSEAIHYVAALANLKCAYLQDSVQVTHE